MSGRHVNSTSQSGGLRALPTTVRSFSQLAPRQIQDELSLAKKELKAKGGKLAVAGVGFGAALAFLSLLVIGLVVAAIMGLATIMPAWLAALLVSAAFLVIAGIGALVGLIKLRSAMPLLPEQAIRGLKHDLGVLREGSDFDASLLDPESPAAKEAARLKEEAKAKAAEEAKAASARKVAEHGPDPSAEQLLKRLQQRREHLVGIRDDLNAQLDVKSQAGQVMDDFKGRVSDVQESAQQRFAQFRKARGNTAEGSAETRPDPYASGSPASSTLGDELASRWKPLTVAAASLTAMGVLLKKLLKP